MKIRRVRNACIKAAFIAAAVVLLISLGAHAARVNKPATPLSKATTYSLAGDKSPVGGMTEAANGLSPGLTVGYTYYDNQHFGSVGRMVETGPHSGETGPAIVHFSWMHLPNPEFAWRQYMYNCYDAGAGSSSSPEEVTLPAQEGGYVNLCVTPDNRAAVGGHCLDGSGGSLFQPHVYYDVCPCCKWFGRSDRMPDNGIDEYMWPKFTLQIGLDTVLHVLALLNDTKPVHELTYFRRTGYEGSSGSVWYPPYVVDSVRNRSHVITSLRPGDDVAMVWLAHPPYQDPDCDTCSGIAMWGDDLMNDMDQDVYLQISRDQGVTWEPRINITEVGIGEESYRAYCDCSILFDTKEYVHVVWAACPWPAIEPNWLDYYNSGPGFDPVKARLFHWSENVPYIRTICSLEYESTDSCGPPLWALRVAKPSISECDDNLYTIWTQFNDKGGLIIDDCAQWGYDQGVYRGAANGDIFLSVSDDDGLTWDAARNLSNSYTPHCDPNYFEDCNSDYWASMTSYGRQNQPGEDWAAATVVDPSGGSATTDYHLDIQYVKDLCAGGIDLNEGIWTNNPIKWFRIPCVDPVLNPVFVAEWTYYGDPNYNRPGEEKIVPLTFQNVGNVTLNYTITIVEYNGPPGWLSCAGFLTTLPCGLLNTTTGDVILNAGGIITTPGIYYGQLHVEGNDPVNLPCDIEIELIVADTVCSPVWDTVNTSCLSLTVSNTGNIGNDGIGKANMDFYPEDCDSTATVYLFDGSPLLGRGTPPDVSFDLSMWGVDWLDDNGLRPQCGEIPTDHCDGLDAEVFESGTFTTQDSTIAFEKIWVAPADDCEFIIQYTRVWAWDGLPHDNLVLGEAVDWDVPGDDLTVGDEVIHPSANYGGLDAPRMLVYQQGYESYADTGYPYNCQYNDERFAGLAFVESYLNGSVHQSYTYNGFVAENDRLQADKGFHDDLLYNQMMMPGLWYPDSVEDLHIVMTYEPSLDLGGDDVYEVVTVLASIEQGTHYLVDLPYAVDRANAWYDSHGGMAMFADGDDDGQIDVCQSCCNLMGDVNGDDSFDPLDAVYFVDWLWRGGAPPVCMAEADADASCAVDPLDVLEIVNYFWNGGEPIAYACNLECWGHIGDCCLMVGDFNHNGIITEQDVQDFIDWLLVLTGPPPPCMEEADCDGDGTVGNLDLDRLVQYVFGSGPPPEPCPE